MDHKWTLDVPHVPNDTCKRCWFNEKSAFVGSAYTVASKIGGTREGNKIRATLLVRPPSPQFDDLIQRVQLALNAPTLSQIEERSPAVTKTPRAEDVGVGDREVEDSNSFVVEEQVLAIGDYVAVGTKP